MCWRQWQHGSRRRRAQYTTSKVNLHLHHTDKLVVLRRRQLRIVSMGLLTAEDFPNVRFLRFLRRQLFRFQKADVCLYSVAKKSVGAPLVGEAYVEWVSAIPAGALAL